jgi:NitT/TauT family transport system ATP-binding protein
VADLGVTGTARVILKAIGVGVVFNSGEPGEVEAIRDISFELVEGETLAIVGPSGCGKSTLFNVIAGLIPPTRGAVYVGGERVETAAGHVGYMLQKDLLLPWRSVLDNVILGLEVRGMPRRAAAGIAERLIASYGLGGFEHARPASLSGGMRQRVAFMRTLAIDPDVILLDEPFSALDFQTRLVLQGEVMRIIRERGKSSILVTHDIGEAITMADRVLVLTPRPGEVRAVHPIALSAGQRNPVTVRGEATYNEMFNLIWDELGISVPSVGSDP